MRTPTAAETLAVAAKYIGYKEKMNANFLDDFDKNAGSANYTMFARDTKGFWGNKQACEWCTTFVLFCFCKAANPDFPKDKDATFAEVKKVQPYTKWGASCKLQGDKYISAKRWTEKPSVGDQAFFTRGHTGLVEKVGKSAITLIEGNSNNKVERRTYSFPNSIFRGFGKPNYAAEPAATTPTEKPKEPAAFKQYTGQVTSSNGLNVRTGPSTSYKKLGALKYGAKIKILEEKSGWGRIVFNEKPGWCCLNWVKKV